MPKKDENNLQITIDKIDKLEEEIEKVQFRISDYIIDNLTEATAKKNVLLDERINLESQIISKFKNFMIKFLTFGCYDKNKKTKNKLKKNKNELDEASNNEAKFKKEYETTISIMLKLMEKLRNLKNASALGFEKDKSKVNSEASTNKSQSSSSKSQKM
ncbi:MAG: hypothetical protein H9Q65_03575 [Spiroplasma ixodetis]|nr:hypothetical protein [Spiroplasma ixodetis]MBP1526859.1 hypothetical protein [Spiroplasma ixodetis]MBP1528316.1 hypothetical protein [Spiroplasma ixodetis]